MAAKQVNVKGIKGSYAFLGEVSPKMLEIGRIYFCILEELNENEEWQQMTEVCKILPSSLKDQGDAVTHTQKIMGQDMKVSVKGEKGQPKKLVWFIGVSPLKVVSCD